MLAQKLAADGPQMADTLFSHLKLLHALHVEDAPSSRHPMTQTVGPRPPHAGRTAACHSRSGTQLQWTVFNAVVHLPVTVLHRRGINGSTTLAHVKVCQLPIVLPSTQVLGILQVVIQHRQLALRRQLQLGHVGIAHVPDVAADRPILAQLLEAHL